LPRIPRLLWCARPIRFAETVDNGAANNWRNLSRRGVNRITFLGGDREKVRHLGVVELRDRSAHSGGVGGTSQVDGRRRPIIDMHLHAFGLEDGEAPPPNPVTRKPSVATSAAAIRQESLAALKRYNIVKAVTSGAPASVAAWREAAPDVIIPGVYVETQESLPDLAMLRADIQAGRLKVLGELGLQYMGLSPADPKLEPYFAPAEELDIPIAIHTGLAAPGIVYEVGTLG
jgi:predicted TIM-barrel fold metal-dependent hydrolase